MTTPMLSREQYAARPTHLTADPEMDPTSDPLCGAVGNPYPILIARLQDANRIRLGDLCPICAASAGLL